MIFEPGKLYKRILSAYVPLNDFKGKYAGYIDSNEIMMYICKEKIVPEVVYEACCHRILFKNNIYLIGDNCLRQCFHDIYIM